MNFYLVSYTATTKNHVMRNSAFEFASTCAEIARLTAEDLLGRDFTLKSFKILGVELTKPKMLVL